MLAELFRQAATKGDWAIALSAAVLGYVLAAAFHIVASPAFTPDICAIVGAGTGLAIKRSVEAIRKFGQDKRLLALRLREADLVIDRLGTGLLLNDADALRFAREAATIRPDLDALTAAIEIARQKL